MAINLLLSAQKFTASESAKTLPKMRSIAFNIFAAMAADLASEKGCLDSVELPKIFSLVAQYFGPPGLNIDEFRLIFQDDKLFEDLNNNELFENVKAYIPEFFQHLSEPQRACLSDKWKALAKVEPTSTKTMNVRNALDLQRPDAPDTTVVARENVQIQFKPIVDVAGFTQSSFDHPINDDGVYVLSGNDIQILLASDGMGSFKNGYLATEILLNEIKNTPLPSEQALSSDTKKAFDQYFEKIFNAAKRKILNVSSGCCYMVCFVYQNNAYFYHSGDCRAIIINNGTVKYQSMDENNAVYYYNTNLVVIDSLVSSNTSIDNNEVYQYLYLPLPAQYNYNYAPNRVSSKEEFIQYFKKNYAIDIQNISSYDELRNILKLFSTHPHSGKHQIINFLGSSATNSNDVCKKGVVVQLELDDVILVMSDGVSSNISTELFSKLSKSEYKDLLSNQIVSNTLEKLRAKRKTRSLSWQDKYISDDLTLAVWKRVPYSPEEIVQEVLKYLCEDSSDRPDISLYNNLNEFQISRLVLALYHQYKRDFKVSDRIYKLLSELSQSNPVFCGCFLKNLLHIEQYLNTESIDVDIALKKGMSLHWETIQIDQEKYSVVVFNPQLQKMQTICLDEASSRNANSPVTTVNFEFDIHANSMCKVEFAQVTSEPKLVTETEIELFEDKNCSKMIGLNGAIRTKCSFYLKMDNQIRELKWRTSETIGTADASVIIKFNERLEGSEKVRTISITANKKQLVPVKLKVKIPPLFDSIIKKFIDDMDSNSLVELSKTLLDLGEYKSVAHVGKLMCRPIKLFSNTSPNEIVTHYSIPSDISLIIDALKAKGLLRCASEVIQASLEDLGYEFVVKNNDMIKLAMDPNELAKSKLLCRQYAESVVNLDQDEISNFVEEECKPPGISMKADTGSVHEQSLTGTSVRHGNQSGVRNHDGLNSLQRPRAYNDDDDDQPPLAYSRDPNSDLRRQPVTSVPTPKPSFQPVDDDSLATMYDLFWAGDVELIKMRRAQLTTASNSAQLGAATSGIRRDKNSFFKPQVELTPPDTPRSKP